MCPDRKKRAVMTHFSAGRGEEDNSESGGSYGVDGLRTCYQIDRRVTDGAWKGAEIR